MLQLVLAMLLAAQRIVFADGSWATFDRQQSCAAVSSAERVVRDPSEQANATFTFDRAGPRRGQFAVRLSKPLRAGSTALLTIGDRPFLLAATAGFAWSRGPAQEDAIAAAVRGSTRMRIEGRAATGRFVDSYSLDGAPGALDAAAACAAHR